MTSPVAESRCHSCPLGTERHLLTPALEGIVREGATCQQEGGVRKSICKLAVNLGPFYVRSVGESETTS